MPVERFNDEDLIDENQVNLGTTVKDLCEKFETEEDISSQERYSIMTKIQTFIQLYKSKLSIYEDMEEMEPEAVDKYSEYKAMFDFFEGLFQDIHMLDDRRIKQSAILAEILRNSNVKDYLSTKIEEYEY